MDGGRLLRGLALVVAVLAVATVAAGVTTSAGGDGDGERAPGVGFGEGTGAGVGGGDDVGLLPDDDARSFDIPAWVVIAPLTTLLWAAVVFLVVFPLHTVWTGRFWTLVTLVREALADALAIAVFFLAAVALFVVLGMVVGAGGGGGLGGEASTGIAVAGGASAIVVPSRSLVGCAALGLGLLGAVAAAVALGRETGDETAEATGTRSGGEHTSDTVAGGLAHVPDEAADVDPSNDVFRAWLALRDHAGGPVSRAETPRAVQRRARAAGVDADVAAEITAMFCAVRYGNVPVTDARERRAAELRSEID